MRTPEEINERRAVVLSLLIEFFKLNNVAHVDSLAVCLDVLICMSQIVGASPERFRAILKEVGDRYEEVFSPQDTEAFLRSCGL